jgi:transcriptional regulator GlxA family with amidase domain
MNMIACASAAIPSALERTRVIDPVQQLAGRAYVSHRRAHTENPTPALHDGPIRVHPISASLQALVAELAQIALTQSPHHDGRVDSDRGVPEVQTPTDVQDEELNNRVRLLLESALQRLPASTSGRSLSQYVPTARPRPRGGIAPSALRRVREHIDNNLAEHIEISDLASLTGLSPCHFSRAFKQSMGVPPHRYLTSRRVQEAARLIESTNRPMFEIALDVGFSDQSHFTRVFSARFGESPARYRHQRR